MSGQIGSAHGVVLVTGTSSGVGLATAVAAARAGFTVVATLRDPSRADVVRAAAGTAGVSVEVRELDITDERSISDAVKGVLDTHGRIDALVNNAGVGSVGTLELLSMTQIRDTFEVNFFGTIAMTKAVLPHLRATGGRLVTVGSAYGVAGQPFNEPYCAAKGAAEIYLEALAPVAAEVGVAVSIVEPGPISSSFVANIPVDRAAMLAKAGDYGSAFRNYLQHIPSMIGSAVQTPEEIAETVLAVLTDPVPPFRTQTSQFSKDFVAEKLADTDGMAVVATARKWLGAEHAD